jgi:hypothetical protein
LPSAPAHTTLRANARAQTPTRLSPQPRLSLARHVTASSLLLNSPALKRSHAMSLHTDWVKAKTKAKKDNGNKDIVFPKDMKLGALLDNMEAAAKAKDKYDGELNAKWAKLVDTWSKASSAASKAAVTYVQNLDKMPLTPAAKKTLDNTLTMNILYQTKKAIDEARRLEPRLARARQAKA